MLTLKKSICITRREAEKISDLLATLGGMSGTADEEFAKECEDAQRLHRKLEELIPRIEYK